MKHLTVAAAALFLLAVPGYSLAQETNDGTNNQTGADQGGNSQGGGGEGDSQCNDVTPDQNYESFSVKCRTEIDTWVQGQPEKSVAVEGDVIVGTVLPDTVEYVEVPAYRSYGYVMVNDKRVLVNRDTRTVVRVY